MQCANPYVSVGLAFGCGQCMPCRYNRRRIWATRICVEAAQYKDNAFVTLTYAWNFPPAPLAPRDMQLFIKRLRKRFYALTGRKFRFFGVGEYGENSGNPHFHFALFNFPTCAYRRSRYNKRITNCCVWCDMVRDCWGKGFVYLGEVENDSAGYIAQYVTKKMTVIDHPWLQGRHPEFARMSLKPGIGAGAMFDVAHTLLCYQNTLDTLSDVPGELRIGPAVRPLGRYLKKHLRKAVGRDEKAPDSVLQEIQAQMLPVRLAAKADNENPSFKARLVAMGEGKRARAEARRRIFAKGRPL